MLGLNLVIPVVTRGHVLMEGVGKPGDDGAPRNVGVRRPSPEGILLVVPRAELRPQQAAGVEVGDGAGDFREEVGVRRGEVYGGGGAGGAGFGVEAAVDAVRGEEPGGLEGGEAVFLGGAGVEGLEEHGGGPGAGEGRGLVDVAEVEDGLVVDAVRGVVAWGCRPAGAAHAVLVTTFSGCVDCWGFGDVASEEAVDAGAAQLSAPGWC